MAGLGVLRTLALGLLGLAVLYGGLLLLVALGQRSLLYFPEASPARPDALQLPGVQPESLATEDGERLVVWWRAPRGPEARVYLYLHGNGGNLALRQARFAALLADGSGLYALSWRGYGGSSGQPSEPGLRLDVRAAWAALVARVPPERIVIFGESLGSTLAVMLAADERPGALVLDSGFDSALAVAREHYGWLPVGWLMRDTYRADRVASQVRAPVFQVHCREDPVTPLARALALHALFPPGAEVEVLEGHCHVPALERYEGALRRFLATLPPVRMPRP